MTCPCCKKIIQELPSFMDAKCDIPELCVFRHFIYHTSIFYCVVCCDHVAECAKLTDVVRYKSVNLRLVDEDPYEYDTESGESEEENFNEESGGESDDSGTVQPLQ